MNTSLQQGIVAAKLGDKKKARQHLQKYLQKNNDSEEAWLWLSKVVDNEKHYKQCLAWVLVLNPNNAEALSLAAASENYSDDTPFEDSDLFSSFISKETLSLEDANEDKSDNTPLDDRALLSSLRSKKALPLTDGSENKSDDTSDNRALLSNLIPKDALSLNSPPQLSMQHLILILQGWWIVVLIVLGGVFAALFVSYVTVPVYEASSRYLITPQGVLQDSRDFTDNINSQDNIMATFAELSKSEAIRNAAFQRLGILPVLEITTDTVVLPDTSILLTSAQGTDPQLVTLFTNAIGEEARSFIRSYYPYYEFTILDNAEVPIEPISPNIPRILIVTILVSVVLGILLALGRAQIILMLRRNKSGNLAAS